MIRRKMGFTLIEVLIVMAIMGLVLALTSEMSINLLRTYKQQSKAAESNIEGIIGLEMLRRDIESAGYGLPWVILAGTTYQEAVDLTALAYNDAPTAPPRAVLSGDNIGTGGNGIVVGSDYLVLKALNLAQSRVGDRLNFLLSTGVIPPPPSPTEALVANDRVIILSPGSRITPTAATETDSMVLIAPSGANLGATLLFNDAAPLFDPDENRIILGVDPSTNLRMPFNRADYYVSTTVALPARCAPGTGVLVKSIVNQSNGNFSNANTLPLLDCVADMQVITITGNALSNTQNNAGVNPANAQTQRSELQEVIVYILAQEGQQDRSYSGTTNPMRVGASAALGRDFNFIAAGIPNWQNYRWKVYTLVARPNLR